MKLAHMLRDECLDNGAAVDDKVHWNYWGLSKAVIFKQYGIRFFSCTTVYNWNPFRWRAFRSCMMSWLMQQPSGSKSWRLVISLVSSLSQGKKVYTFSEILFSNDEVLTVHHDVVYNPLSLSRHWWLRLRMWRTLWTTFYLGYMRLSKDCSPKANLVSTHTHTHAHTLGI